MRRECGASLWEFNLRDVLRWCRLMQDYQVRTYTPVLDSTALALLLSVNLAPNSTREACKD